MSSARRRAYAFGLVLAVVLFVLPSVTPATQASTAPIEPAAVMTVTVVLDRAAYLSGDHAIATALVYRTPLPSNYTYTWTVRDSFGRIVNTTANATAKLTYAIPLNYTGLLTFVARVDDGAGLSTTSLKTVVVSIAVMSLRLDRGEFSPGDLITASYSVTSHVILRPTYDYEVDDNAATIVLSNTTSNTSFSFRTPALVASRTYQFLVTARDGTNLTRAQVIIAQASGALLSVTFDRTSYAPGETIRAHLTVAPRGNTALPIQFTWTLSLGIPFGGSPAVSAITTVPEADLYLPIPGGLGSGDLLVAAGESSTATVQYQTVHIGTTNTLWSTEIGGIPLFAVLLGLSFIGLLVMVLGLWRRIGGGHLLGPRVTPPPPPGETVHAPATAPMSVVCKHCGKSIDLTTSRRPVEVMCPACGETQLVA